MCPQPELVWPAGGAPERSGAEVPLVLMDRADPQLLAELLEAVERVARAGAFTGGAEVEEFERELAVYCGSAEAVGVSSGTEALALALRGLGVGPGDEVIVPTNSFIATAEAVSLVGALPRPIDVDPCSWTITADAVRRALNRRTRCIIPVHLHGRTADLEPLLALCREQGLWLLEDACQAHGALYQGRRAGSIGDAGCFSFYPAKNLGAWGDGGAIVTDDPELASRLRLLRAHGESPRYNHRVAGTTARLDAIQAAVLRLKLRRLDEWNGRRRRIAERLDELLASAPVELATPAEGPGDHVYHHYVVRSDRRDALRAHLGAAGIASALHYPIPIHLSEAYANLGLAKGEMPVAERLALRSCSLPIGPLQSEEEIERIAAAVNDFAPAGSG